MEDDLPEIWRMLAKISPKQHRALIQQHIDDMSNDLADGLALVVTPMLAKKVSTLESCMGNRSHSS